MKKRDKIINDILRFIIRNEKLYKVFTKYKWFNDIVYEQAQKIIGNR